MTTPQQMIDRGREHDDKGRSEEMCTRCGWVMGSPPLNCLNDDTAHVFPSQLPASYDYGFSIAPGSNASPASRALFTLLPRVELTATEADWTVFVAGLERDGIELHEVERAPHFDPVFVQ